MRYSTENCSGIWIAHEAPTGFIIGDPIFIEDEKEDDGD